MTDNTHGKWFEDKVTGTLKEIQEKHPTMFHRFPDTRAARNILPAQPADYLFAMRGTALLIEAKCSEVHEGLRSGFSSLWPKPEAAFHRKWHRSGCPSLVVFCDYITEKVEIWQGTEIAKYRAFGKPIPKHVEPLVIGFVGNLKEIILEAVDISKGNEQ